MGFLKRIDFDKVGVCASAVCAVHCLLTGLAFGLLSVSGLAFMENEVFDVVFIGLAGILGAVAVVHGRRKHHSYYPAAVFVFGMVAIVVGNFFVHHVHREGVPEGLWDHYGHTICMVLGGLSLVGFHTLNVWLQRHGGCGCNGCLAAQHHDETTRPAEPLARIS